jgi:hypothetical protein
VAAPTISSFETGHRPPRREYAVKADTVLGAEGNLDALWLECNQEGEIPASWRDFAKVERKATEIRQYQPIVIPGLLQTSGYIRAILHNDRTWRDKDRVESMVTARTSRLAELEHVELTFVVKEAALAEVVGSRQIHVQQLEHILDLVDQRRIRMTVIPRFAPHCPATAGSFRIMDLGDGRTVVHVEHEGGLNVISGAEETKRITTLFGDLQTEALSQSASVELIHEICEGLQ